MSKTESKERTAFVNLDIQERSCFKSFIYNPPYT